MPLRGIHFQDPDPQGTLASLLDLGIDFLLPGYKSLRLSTIVSLVRTRTVTIAVLGVRRFVVEVEFKFGRSFFPVRFGLKE